MNKKIEQLIRIFAKYKPWFIWRPCGIFYVNFNNENEGFFFVTESPGHVVGHEVVKIDLFIKREEET